VSQTHGQGQRHARSRPTMPQLTHSSNSELFSPFYRKNCSDIIMMIMVVPYLKHSIKNIVRSTSFVIALGLFIYHGGWPCDLCQGQSIQGQSQKKLAFRPRPRITIPGTYTVYWRVCVCVCVCVYPPCVCWHTGKPCKTDETT